MNFNPLLLIALCITFLVILFLISRLRRVRGQLCIIEEALEDIMSGNANRRVLTRKSDMTERICFAINEIAVENQARLRKQKQSEQAYKRLMTSLSHDVKTPLASLIGYLEAITNNLVTGEEKEAYLHIAVEKAYYLKHFIETLFEWVKLDAKEQTYHFELCDFNELTRNIAAEWIGVLEQRNFEYDFDIPEEEYSLRVDAHAYTRIFNNLFQNALIHSGGNKLTLQLLEDEQQVNIMVSDNGKGISSSELSHIFERMYQCDSSRSARGNGLGLSITRELVKAHNGTIKADSKPGMGTKFTIQFPKSF
ncbi:MAG: HAMP domain-containing histidine kinase [Ruminococcus flavefaciens]|nr:HAMP domain-containing histidine kinase [Ruminococcus flavefaciens]